MCKVILLFIMGNIILLPNCLRATDYCKPVIDTWGVCCCGNVHWSYVYGSHPDSCPGQTMQSIEFLEGKNYELETNNYKSCSDTRIKWRLNISNWRRHAWARLRFTNCAGADTVANFEFLNTEIEVADHDFGLVPYDSPGVDTIMCYNTGLAPFEIEWLEFQNCSHNFEIGGFHISFPTKDINPGDSIAIPIKVSTREIGEYTDSLIIETYCYRFVVAKLTAKVVAPVIRISDYDFGEVEVGDVAHQTLSIENKGEAPLIVDGYELNESYQNHSFTPKFKYINFDEPLTIKPGKFQDFRISFAPDAEEDYYAEISFQSNTYQPNKEEADNLAVLKGKGKINSSVQAGPSNAPAPALTPNVLGSGAVARLYFNHNSRDRLSAIIVNELGAIVHEYTELTLTADGAEIIIPNIPAGIYYLKLQGAESYPACKILIQ